MTSIGTHVPAAAFVAPALQPAFADHIVIDVERPEDAVARESLLDRSFGPARFRKTCHKLRAGRLPARGLSFVARVPRLGGDADVGASSSVADVIGTVRLWHIDAGGVSALMLGPLAVDARYRSFGLGRRLMEVAIDRARELGHTAVLLVGDAPYYARFGFSRTPALGLVMPGPVEQARFLGLELLDGALSQAKGMVRPTGAYELSSRRHPQRPRLPKAA